MRHTLATFCLAIPLFLASSSAATPESVSGIGVLRNTSAWIGDRANLPRYGLAIMSFDELSYVQQINAANPGEIVLLYKGAVEIGDCGALVNGCVGGVTLRQATAHDAAKPRDPWILLDAAGKPIQNPVYPGTFLADVGSASYQTQWVANVARALRAGGFDGVFVDNVLAQVSGWSGGTFPTAYPTDAAWEAAMRSFVAAVGPALKARGFYVLANSFKSGSNDGHEDVAWWRTIAPSVSGLMAEYWQQSPPDPSRVYDADPCCWTGHWQSWLGLANAAQENGADFVPLQTGASTDTPLMTYGKASFLLVWNGKGGGYIFNPSDPVDPWNAAWTTDVGRPLGARYRVGAAWRRDYTRGTAIVNPSPSRAQNVDLGRGYRSIGGGAVSSITVAPRSAAILIRGHG